MTADDRIFLVIDNTKNIEKAKCTPVLLDFMRSRNLSVVVVGRDAEALFEVLRLQSDDIVGVILTGGPKHLSDDHSTMAYNRNILALLTLSVPFLGICYGFQVMAAAYEGQVSRLPTPHKNISEPIVLSTELPHSLVNILESQTTSTPTKSVWANHRDCVLIKDLPYGFALTATSVDGTFIQACENPARHLYGVQFHPEMDPTFALLRRFVDLCLYRQPNLAL